ncbi:MAG: metal-dependent hydrolase [Halobacteriales archaeon]
MALGCLIGIALLGGALDRRSLTIVTVAAALPDLDAALSLYVPGATNAALHSGFLPIAGVALLYWETERRGESWVADRVGSAGIRVAWVALAAYAVAGIGLDLFNVEGVALFYPVSTRYYAVVGQLIASTEAGLIQTYVQLGSGWLDVASPGRTTNHHIATWINPTPRANNPAGVERRLRIVDSGWQLVLLVTALVAAPARWVFDRTPN